MQERSKLQPVTQQNTPVMMKLLLLLGLAGAAGAEPPQPPFGLRTEYLGAAPSNVAKPPPPPPPPASSGELCTAPDGSKVGGVVGEWAAGSRSKPAPPLELSCKSGVITRVEAFFGTPQGTCASGFARDAACDAPTAAAVVDALCLHKSRCSVPTAANESHWQGAGHPTPLAALFLPDPCMGTSKVLAVKVTCAATGDTPLHGRSPLAPPTPTPAPSPALGIDAARPRFSWMLNSTLRGDTQTAFEIKIVEQFNQTAVVWASGKVAAANHTQVEYGGSALAPLGAYSWSVRWWSSASGTSSEFSTPQRFDMAPANTSWADAEWIGGGNQLRTEFSLRSASVASATLCVAGLGLAQPWLNGQRVSDHAMGPQSQLFTRVLYTTFDVTGRIKPGGGPNVMGMMVGSGKYGYLGAWCQADSAVECLAVRALLHLRYADGQEEIIGTKATEWKAREGPVRTDDYYYGEFYDARREHTGWAAPGFNRTLGWGPAVTMEPTVSGTMSSAVIQPIRPSEKFEPVSIKVLNKPSDSGQFPQFGHPEGMGIAIYDFVSQSVSCMLLAGGGSRSACVYEREDPLFVFIASRVAVAVGWLLQGQNLAGYCILRLPSCTKGNVIRLRYAETTWPDANGETRIYNQFQSCSTAGSQCAFQEDTYICSGKGDEVYEPTSTYVRTH
jgi:hypothetical protein